jgi:chlorophyll synthase
MGIGSLPVRLGVTGAARTACAVMLLPQFVVVGLLLHWGAPLHAAAVGALVVVQALMMRRFLSDPRAQALWYSGFGVPVFVTGMMVSAFALRFGAGGA